MIEGHVHRYPRPRVRRRAEAGKLTADHALDGFPVEVPDGHDCHQVGPVPIPVEALQRRSGSGFQDLGLAYGETVGVERALEEYGELGIEHAGLRPAPEPPLLDHHAALLVHLLGIEEHRLGPVLQDLKRRLQDGGIVHGHAQHVDGFVEAGVGVDVGAELHPDRLQIVDQLLLLEVPGAVERHVLGKVGQAKLVLVLQDGAGVHQQAELGAVLRSAVLAHIVAQSVVELANGYGRIPRERAVERRSLR